MRSVLSVLLLLAAVLAVYFAMWRGWRHRGERQADVPSLHPVVAPVDAPVLRKADGRYFATTTAGDWTDRIVVHGLGVRSPCTLRLTPAGLDVLRGDLSFGVPRAGLVGARHDRGTAGKVLPPHGVLVVTWRHPGTAGVPGGPQRTFDSGFRLQHAAEHQTWVTALTQLASGVER